MGRAKKIASYAAISALSLTGIVGVLHLPFARHFLMRLGGCPIGTPEQTEASRRDAVRQARGIQSAPARPAIGFELDVTTLDDVRAWSNAHGLDCEEVRDHTLVRCRDVPARAVDDALREGVFAEIAFGVSLSSGRVVAVTTARDRLSGAVAAEEMGTIAASLATSLGPPASSAGVADAGFLSAGDYHTATIEYAFTDYLATVTVTRLPGKGVLLREQYYSARD